VLRGLTAVRPTRWLSRWRLVALAVFVVAGSLFATSALAAGGLDLRASSVTDLDTVVRQERQRTDALQERVAELTKDVGTLGKDVDDAEVGDLQREAALLRATTGFERVRGPAVTVVLTDAPKAAIDRAVDEGGVTADELVVHQQDIQAVVNALWAGGAEAMTLQDQRVISTTGIKCVGNTVVLHGVPYAPPYEITAIGDVSALTESLENSEYIDGYKTYVKAHDLGYEVSLDSDVTMPAYEGSTDLRYAEGGAAPDVGRD
jgi:uncharacterized protein YlxW (UPF0749 family)